MFNNTTKSIPALILLLLISLCGYAQQTNNQQYLIPLGGNTWIDNKSSKKEKILSADGLKNWEVNKEAIFVYVKIANSGSLDVALRMKVKQKTFLKASIGTQTVTFNTGNIEFNTVSVGKFQVSKPGYIRIKLQGISGKNDEYADVSDLILSGEACNTPPDFVRNNQDNYFYWGRRGPSVHLGYQIPTPLKEQIEWFYSELTVPKNNDMEGSYFMANGFAEGYFGMQVNSPTERRILFSVWSPFQTDDPVSIPDSLKITLLKKGSGVKTGEFGNEGSGGQSYLVFNWKAGKTYRFLNSARPDGQNNTIYTAYFYDPDKSEWLLIASFKRPVTNTYLKGIHSFLENFIPGTGNQARMAIYGNQWVRNTTGQWTAITQAKFTGDLTARKRYRLDYAGGTYKENWFYLKNCGFFDDTIALDQLFQRKDNNQIPAIPFNELP